MIRISLLFLLLISFSYTTISAQIQDKVNFEKGEISIEIHPEQKKINGTVDYTFEVLNAIDSIFLDAKSMEFSSVLLNGKKVKYS
ncbi:MAG: M1 family peptidase, partial [Cellulophaga sp.]|nr:M1 family peptidase [Cellulophaga sp.]